MSQKCVHKGCGKKFTDPEEECKYHPGPPIFHEGQKGWKCCKPRVLTFDEFLTIPPCTTGIHSTIDDTPAPEPKPATTEDVPAPTPIPTSALNDISLTTRVPQPQATEASPAPPPEPESEDDDPSIPIPSNATCRRRSCLAPYKPKTSSSSREGEGCIFHPGHPVFHEGSKGWTCCKRRVLEFDEFMQIKGCQNKDKHMFVGSGKKGKGEGGGVGEEKIETVRHDFYQTPTTIHASLYLKSIAKPTARIAFSSPTTIDLDLLTTDKKRYKTTMQLCGTIDVEKSTFKIMGTKVELVLAKADGVSWPVLKADERRTGEIIQVGRAGRA